MLCLRGKKQILDLFIKKKIKSKKSLFIIGRVEEYLTRSVREVPMYNHIGSKKNLEVKLFSGAFSKCDVWQKCGKCVTYDKR